MFLLNLLLLPETGSGPVGESPVFEREQAEPVHSVVAYEVFRGQADLGTNFPKDYRGTLPRHVSRLDGVLHAVCSVRTGLQHCNASARHGDDELPVAAAQKAPPEGEAGVRKEAERDNRPAKSAAVVEV